jgi:hypothetical protein
MSSLVTNSKRARRNLLYYLYLTSLPEEIRIYLLTIQRYKEIGGVRKIDSLRPFVTRFKPERALECFYYCVCAQISIFLRTSEQSLFEDNIQTAVIDLRHQFCC